MAESTGWLLRLIATAVVVAGLAVGTAGARPAWAAPGAVPEAVAQGDDDENEDEDADDADAEDEDADHEEEADEDEEQDDDAETYESPQYGYTLAYDPADWEVFQEDDDPDDAYDRIFLSNGVSIVGLTGDPDYDEDSLDDCLADYFAGLENDAAASDIEPLDEPDAEGDDDDRVWQTFTYTYEVDDDETELVRYLECRYLGDGLTVVILHQTLADEYEAEIEAREDLLAGFSPLAGTDEDEDDSDTDADEDDADADADDADEDEDEDDLLADVEEYEEYDISGGFADHTDDPVDYEQTPPVGGAHSPVWQDCGFYDEEIVAESGVHSMEHGAVWITYDPDLDADEIESLEELADSEAYVLVSPFEDLPSPVVASAWGVQLELDGADDPRLEAFVEFYAEGPQTPEPGAPCFGGTSETA